jgi:hypothetical protein
MTEAEWLACTDFDLLWDTLAPQATARKRRLFHCAMVRRGWSARAGRPGRPDRQAVEVAESYADGVVGHRELATAHQAAVQFDPQVHGDDVAATRSDDDLAEAWSLTIGERSDAPPPSADMWSRLELLRELVGHPFRAIALDPAWLTWQGSTVARLAQVAYEERNLPEGTLDLARLAILADALEDAGCTDTDLLNHLRGPGPHVRGAGHWTWCCRNRDTGEAPCGGGSCSCAGGARCGARGWGHWRETWVTVKETNLHGFARRSGKGLG